MLERVTPDDIVAAVEALVNKAKAGDAAAAGERAELAPVSPGRGQRARRMAGRGTMGPHDPAAELGQVTWEMSG